MAELIITEKPKSAQKIAEALADKKITKQSLQGVPYYEIEHKGKKIIVGCAVGHVFGLAEKNAKGWKYPVFDIEWKPAYETNKESSHTKKYIAVLKKLSAKADSYTISTDFDTEGEVIGWNVLRFVCKQKDAGRMKFSTLTKPDLISSYENKSPHLDWGQAIAGETRHMLDWYYGINLSRALTSSIKSAGMFKILSSGRVQGPALKIIVEREKDIMAFKPEPFWQIELLGEVLKGKLTAWHEKDKFWKKEEAEIVLERVKGKDGVAKEVKRAEFRQMPPNPFDLTSLQTEAYKCFGTSPKATLDIAQELYTSGWISYPRTSSQQLPTAIGFKSILSQLSKQPEYGKLCKILLAKNDLKPNDGKKTDPAHPAIFPTGIAPKKLDKRSQNIYDLIVKRFLATFAEPAIRENQTIKIDINGEIFVATGILTKYKGWHLFYEPYARFKEEELLEVRQGEDVKNKKITMHEKETQPPKRYTEASLIKELERKNLGTKATRSDIVETLFRRGYVDGKAITATDLGIKTVETLEKYIPKILDEELTRHFEDEMEEVREKKKQEDAVLEEAREVLTKILTEFKEKEKDIGKGLISANKESEEKANTVGKCPNCETGNLTIKRGKFGKFIACSNYPDCKTTFNLPKSGLVKVTENLCKECGHPVILIIRKAKKPQEVCINSECPSKKVDESKFKERKCPKCKEGDLVLRKSIYGAFIACNKYPKCRYTERL